MKFSELRPGQQILHPRLGLGDVKVLTEKSVEILFNEGRHTLSDSQVGELKRSEPQVQIDVVEKPLSELITEVVEKLSDKLGLRAATTDDVSPQLAPRWVGGKLVIHPNDPALVTKEVELEIFFRKIVNVRDYLRVLEQKINAHPKLNDAERIELQYYLTKVAGSLTTFNLLFKEKEQTF